MTNRPADPPAPEALDPASSTPATPETALTAEERTAIADMNANTLVERMEIEILSIDPERLVARMPVAGNTQPYGLLHGGASVVLAETLGSIGSAQHAGSMGKIAVGLDINATHHRAAKSGFVTGVATPISLGGTVASYEIVITDEQERRVCTSRITCLLREIPPGS